MCGYSNSLKNKFPDRDRTIVACADHLTFVCSPQQFIDRSPVTCMPGLIDDLQQFQLTSIPQLDRLVKATSYEMFAIWAKTEGIDGVHVSYNFFCQVIIVCIPGLQAGIPRAAEQKTTVGTITKGKHGIGMSLPFLFDHVAFGVEYPDKVVAVADG